MQKTFKFKQISNLKIFDHFHNLKSKCLEQINSIQENLQLQHKELNSKFNQPNKEDVGQAKLQYQKINEVGDVTVMISRGGHILEDSKQYPRQLQTALNFQTTFDILPELFISPHYLDWKLQHRFLVKVTLITKKGFLLITNAVVAASAFYEIRIIWFAFQDPRIQVITFQQNDVQELQTGSGDRTITFTINHEFTEATNGLISLIGVKHTKSNQIVEIKIEQVLSSAVIVSVNTNSDSQIKYVRFNILLGTDQSLWSSPTQPEIFNPPLYGNFGYRSRQLLLRYNQYFWFKIDFPYLLIDDINLKECQCKMLCYLWSLNSTPNLMSTYCKIQN